MILAVVVGSLIAADSASACSCASSEEPETLRGVDAAVTARLIEVEKLRPKGTGTEPSSGRAEFTYRILRVYKGSRRYNLREGEELVLKNTTDGANCGLPTKDGKRYGLMLFESRGGLNTNLCGVRGPRELRQAARRSGNARSGATGTGCGSTAA